MPVPDTMAAWTGLSPFAGCSVLATAVAALLKPVNAPIFHLVDLRLGAAEPSRHEEAAGETHLLFRVAHGQGDGGGVAGLDLLLRLEPLHVLT